jgi:hypothetical protein
MNPGPGIVRKLNDCRSGALHHVEVGDHPPPPVHDKSAAQSRATFLLHINTHHRRFYSLDEIGQSRTPTGHGPAVIDARCNRAFRIGRLACPGAEIEHACGECEQHGNTARGDACQDKWTSFAPVGAAPPGCPPDLRGVRLGVSCRPRRLPQDGGLLDAGVHATVYEEIAAREPNGIGGSVALQLRNQIGRRFESFLRLLGNQPSKDLFHPVGYIRPQMLKRRDSVFAVRQDFLNQCPAAVNRLAVQ